MLVVLGSHVEGLKFLNVLLGGAPPLTPSQGFYQRMLANDPHEAAEQAERLLRDMPLIDYYDNVVMDGLRLAQTDADLHKLAPTRLPEIRDAALSMIESLSEELTERSKRTSETAAILPDSWREEGAIICIAGQSALDELGAIILVQLLQHQGFKPKLMRMAEVSVNHMQIVEITGVKLVCISLLDVEHRGAYLKFLVRRLRRILPGGHLLGGFWKHDDDDVHHKAIVDNIPVDAKVKSLADAIDHCLREAAREVSAVVTEPATGLRGVKA